MSLLSKIASVALKPSVAIGNAISNAIKPGSGKTTSAQLAATPAGKALGGAIAATAIGLGVAAAPAGSIVSAVKSVGSSVGKVAAANPIKTAIAAPIVAGIIVSNPTAPFQAAGQLGSFGSDIGKFSANPSLQTGKDIVTGSPIIAATVGILGVAAIGKAALPALATYANTQAIKENTAATIQPIPTGPSIYPNMPVMKESDVSAPITPLQQPQGINPQGSEKAPVKRRKSRQEPRSQTISQRVDVEVNAIQGNKKYIRLAQYA